MKIGIVTIYNSQNCGSFLQSLALLNHLKELNYDVAIVKNNMYYKNRFVYRAMVSLKYLLKGQTQKSKFILKTTVGFKNSRKNYYRFRSIQNNDVCIYGSDTIWNYDNIYFGNEWAHYWGGSYNGPKIAYAPSIGHTAIENILNSPKLCNCIKEFSSLSVRDENTYKVVSSILDKNFDITYVVDPTMLMPKSFYEGIAKECKEEKFILFYYFGTLDKAYMEEIKKYAEKNGQKLICFGDNIKGVDKQLCFNPLDMMGYYSKADMIITNTFHGNVFSLIFNKPFINIDAGKAKVDDLLNNFGMTERTIKDPSRFAEIASRTIDFENINILLEEKRSASGEYLKKALKKCEEEN